MKLEGNAYFIYSLSTAVSQEFELSKTVFCSLYHEEETRE
jgi:hypothetical protein